LAAAVEGPLSRVGTTGLLTSRISYNKDFPGEQLKHVLAKWTHWILAVLTPLGIWGVMGFAVVDAAFLGMPLDAIVGGYVYAAPRRFLLISAMAAAGSALGSFVIYWIGYKGGEVLLVKRVGEERFKKIHAAFERYGFLGLMVPSMLPPPTPFKLFVLTAGVIEMSFAKFLGAIFAGRFLRFCILSLLVIRFGPEIVEFFGHVVARHARLTLAVIALLALIGWWVWWMKKKNGKGDAGAEIMQK
jgi:membrane protein YqaA with SNARE-associated domain